MLNIEKTKKYLQHFSKDQLVFIVLILLVAIALFYPVTKQTFLIDKKIDMLGVKVKDIQSDVTLLKKHSGLTESDIREIVRENNAVMKKDICKKIDQSYHSGFQMMEQMNRNVIHELDQVQEGDKNLFEALKSMESKNDQLIKQYKYLDSLRQDFWQQDWHIEVKPTKKEGRAMK